jgi:hypothetical protein
MSCAICAERIGAVIDGRFCEVCGNPVHNGCAKSPPAPASNDDVLSVAEEESCPRCGGDPKTPIAWELRRIVLSQRVAAEVAPRLANEERYAYWTKMHWYCTFMGLFILGWGVVFRTEPRLVEDRSLGYPLIVLGSLVAAGGLLLTLHQRSAARRYRRELWGEEDEPQEESRGS